MVGWNGDKDREECPPGGAKTGTMMHKKKKTKENWERGRGWEIFSSTFSYRQPTPERARRREKHNAPPLSPPHPSHIYPIFCSQARVSLHSTTQIQFPAPPPLS
eukprot:Hpha_TRINITY_DN15513_c5_g10::TRINITY_DN15513_c5_g10_i1::g.107625::m.107625